MDDPRLMENDSVLEFFNDWYRELQQTDLPKQEKNKRFISDKLYFDLQSMIIGFKSYCNMLLELFPAAGINAAHTNQDKTENLFGFIRAANGPNEMPNVLEYGE
jgi:hypothetical protein